MSLADYLTPASAGQGIAGAAAQELNEALELPSSGPSGGVEIPWALLAGNGPEIRQGENGGDPERPGLHRHRRLCRRHHGPAHPAKIICAGNHGFTRRSAWIRVPAGRSSWPLIASGVDPDQAVEGDAAAAAVEATFSIEELKPKRLTGVYEMTHEAMAQVGPDLEQALRRDLADAVHSKMSGLILTGDEATNAQEPDGFLTTIVAPGDPGAVVEFAGITGLPASAVDGLHAESEDQVNVLLGVETYQLAATLYRTGGGGNEAAIEQLKRRCMMCKASCSRSCCRWRYSKREFGTRCGRERRRGNDARRFCGRCLAYAEYHE